MVRMHGEFTLVQALATSAGDGFQSFAVGVCIVTENAVGIGITAIPHPLTDIGWDGWWYHSVHAAVTSLETTEVARGPSSALRVPFETKSMRKLKETDVIVGVVELGTEIGTASVDFTARSRILVKLA